MGRRGAGGGKVMMIFILFLFFCIIDMISFYFGGAGSWVYHDGDDEESICMHCHVVRVLYQGLQY